MGSLQPTRTGALVAFSVDNLDRCGGGHGSVVARRCCFVTAINVVVLCIPSTSTILQRYYARAVVVILDVGML